jgi:ferredoxin
VLVIRPPDPSIKGRTLMYGPYSSAEATRRYIHLAFRDAHTAIDLTTAAGGFWRPPVPPGLAITTNNLDPTSSADLHLDFTDTGLSDEAFDLVVYDPPHLADLGAESIMGRRFGSAAGTAGLSDLVTAGALEAWRIARIGMLVKLADHSHGGEFLQLSRWVAEKLGVDPYFVAHTTRTPLLDGKWEAQRVPRSNGAVYLVWRKGSQQHRDFDALYERQERREALRCRAEKRRLDRRSERPKRCVQCNAPLTQRGDRPRLTCSSVCRQQAYRRRLKDPKDEQRAADRERFGDMGQADARQGVRDSGAPSLLAGGFRGRFHRGAGGCWGAEFVQAWTVGAGQAGVAV